VDGLRGIAMLMVLVYHCSFADTIIRVPAPHGDWYLDVTAPLHYGYLGVHLFLVLSGFCLAYPLALHGAGSMYLDWQRFFRRRARRILPAYYMALALFTVRPVLERAFRSAIGQPDGGVEGYTTGEIISHLFLVHNLSPAWNLEINAAFWTLGLEWQLYLVFPLLVCGFQRWGPTRMLAATLAVTLAYRTAVYSTQHLFFVNAVPGRLFEFVLGMAAALALRNRERSELMGWQPRYALGCILFGALALGAHHGWSPQSPITDALWGLTFFCLLMHAGTRWPTGGGWLSSRPLVALGVISYSVYLTHLGVVAFFQQVLALRHLPPLTTLLLFDFLVAPLAIAIGWVFFRLVEVRLSQADARLS
jgi:peptidoglycan/LPS O-acetylase OafA/YrhL